VLGFAVTVKVRVARLKDSQGGIDDVVTMND